MPYTATGEYMRISVVLFATLTAPLWSQEPVVSKASIWSDTVKRGEMLREVRGLGEIKDLQTVTLRIAETQVKDVKAGQEVSIDAGQEPKLAGKVTRVGSSPLNGVVTADVRLNAPLPQALKTGRTVDGAISIEKLSNVTYVGRPVFGPANGEANLFKIDSDGMHATNVKVRFGRTSVNTIEVLEGLQPGDNVILSDMSANAGQPRIRLQ